MAFHEAIIKLKEINDEQHKIIESFAEFSVQTWQFLFEKSIAPKKRTRELVQPVCQYLKATSSGRHNCPWCDADYQPGAPLRNSFPAKSLQPHKLKPVMPVGSKRAWKLVRTINLAEKPGKKPGRLGRKAMLRNAKQLQMKLKFTD